MTDRLGFETWTLPSTGTFQRLGHVTRHVNQYNLTDRFNGLNDGQLEAADTWPHKDTTLVIDSANHANDQGAVLRVTWDGTPILHYVIYSTQQQWSEGTLTVPLTLKGMELFLDKARVHAKDYPADPIRDGNWTYGAASILERFGGVTANELQTVTVTGATTGTYTLTDGTSTTDPIAWDAAASTIATRLETDITGIVDVSVSGTGAAATPYEIEFGDPASYPQLTVGTNSTNGTVTTGTVTQGGTVSTRPWTRSRNPVTGQLHGRYDSFTVATSPLYGTDTYSLEMDAQAPAGITDYPGWQMYVRVTPGVTYRATAPVYVPTASGTGLSARLVIRDMEEGLIGKSGDATLTNDAWNVLDAGQFTIPEGVTQVIYRIGFLNPGGTTGPVYLAGQSAVLAPGDVAKNLGTIMNELLSPITTRGVLDWLTPTWTGTLDSSGAAWDKTLSWNISRGQSLLQLLEYAKRWGYESRIRWDVGNARFEWDLFNPGNGGTDKTVLAGGGPAITGRDGAEGSGPIRRRMPEYTHAVAEGDAGAWGEYEDTVLSGAWGRLEGYFGNRQGAADLDTLAQQLVDDSTGDLEGRRVRLSAPYSVPFADYEPGDFITLNLAPVEAKKTVRVEAVTMASNEDAPVYDVHLQTLVLEPASNAAEMIRTLWRKFEGLEQVPTGEGSTQDPDTTAVSTSPLPPFIVAASNSSDVWKAVATYQCDGTSDQLEIQQAIDDASALAYDSEVILAPGNYNVNVTDGGIAIDVTGGVRLVGAGRRYAARIQNTGNTLTTASYLIRLRSTTELRNVYVDAAYNYLSGVLLDPNDTDIVIDGCYFDVLSTPAVDAIHGDGADYVTVRDCVFDGNAVVTHIRAYNISREWNVINNHFWNGKNHLWIGDQSAGQGPYGWNISGNVFEDSALQHIVIDSLVGETGQFGHRIVNNRFWGWGTGGTGRELYGIDVVGPCDEAIIAANQFNGSSDRTAIGLEDCGDILIADNQIADVTRGLLLHGASRCKVSGNFFKVIALNGIGVELTDISDDNFITDNAIHTQTGSAGTAGVKVTTANCNDNLIVGNDLRNGWTTPIDDSGTGTLVDWPADATYGDNFT